MKQMINNFYIRKKLRDWVCIQTFLQIEPTKIKPKNKNTGVLISGSIEIKIPHPNQKNKRQYPPYIFTYLAQVWIKSLKMNPHKNPNKPPPNFNKNVAHFNTFVREVNKHDKETRHISKIASISAH